VEEDEEDERRRGSIKINVEKNLEDPIGLNSNNSNDSTLQQTQRGNARRSPEQENEHQREVNTPSPEFQTS
jgi:hypothetical protein